MSLAELERLLASRDRTQRQTLARLASTWVPTLRAMGDDDLLVALRAVRKAINSKRLRPQRDALIGKLRRDGLADAAALPNPAPAIPVDAPGPAPSDPDPDPAEAGPHHPGLDAQLAASPRDAAALTVYRDWLEGRGLVTDGRVDLGPLADADDMLSALDWTRGFITRARLSYSMARYDGERPPLPLDQALAALLDDPGPGRFIRALTIGLVRHDANDYASVCEVLARRVRPALEALELGDFGYEQCELNWSDISSTHNMWPALPRLRSLRLRAGGMDLDGLDLPALRELTIVTGGLSAAALAAISAASWPALETLSVQVGRTDQGATDNLDILAPLLTGARAPKLTSLGVTNCEFTDALCERLPHAPLLAQLRHLDLSMGTMTTAGVAALRRHAAAFSHLELIDVHDNYLPAEAETTLAEIGPTILFDEQRTAEPGRALYASAFE